MVPRRANDDSFDHIYDFDKEVEGIFNRIHFGSRPLVVDFFAIGDESDSDDADDEFDKTDGWQMLHSLSHPDEIHSEMGKSLSRVYIASLSASLREENLTNPQEDTIDRGIRIIKALFCQGDERHEESRNSSHAHGKNNASVAHAFFVHLALSQQSSQPTTLGDAIKTFVSREWQKWCLLCEELSSKSGEGTDILDGCLRGYASFCFSQAAKISQKDSINEQNFDYFSRFTVGCAIDATEKSTANAAADVYQSLTKHSSRKFWIRQCIHHAFDFRSQSVQKPGLLAESLLPLMNCCLLQSTFSGLDHHQHEERQLMLRLLTRECSILLSNFSYSDSHSDTSSALIDVAAMVNYLGISLQSFLTQGLSWLLPSCKAPVAQSPDAFSVNHSCSIDYDEGYSILYEFGYDWLVELSHLIQSTLHSLHHNSQRRPQSSATDAPLTTSEQVALKQLSKTVQLILHEILPQLSIATTPFRLDMTRIFSSLSKCVAGIAAFDHVKTFVES